MKNRTHYFRVLGSCSMILSLISCARPSAVASSGLTEESNIQQDSTSGQEDFTVPTQGPKTQFYLKESLNNFQRGQVIDLSQYIGLVPGSEDSPSSTGFTASVLEGDNTPSAGYIEEGNGNGTHLVISKPGQIIFNVSANGVTKTYAIETKEARFMSEILDHLSSYGVNYDLALYSQDPSTNERTLQVEASRGENYLYNKTGKNGFLLSKNDDQMYEFTLEDENSSNLNVKVPPISDKLNYNMLFAPLSKFADGSSWTYSTVFANNLLLKKYNVAYTGASQDVTQFFYSLFNLTQSYQYNGSTYYPAAVYASLQGGVLSFLPVLSNGSSLLYFPEVEVSNPGQVSIPALDNYIKNHEAPAKADVSEIVNNIRHLTEVFDYSVSAKTVAYDSQGKVVLNSSPYLKTVFDGLLWEPYHYVTEPAMFKDNFHGFYPQVLGGGLFNKDGKTFEFLDDDGDGIFDETVEYIEYGQTTSSKVWWGYSFINYFLVGWGYSISDVKNGYPSYDEAIKTYEFSGVVQAASTLIEGGIMFGYSRNVLNNNEYVKATINTSYASSKFHFTYNAQGKLSKMVNTIEFTFPKTLFDDIDQDYKWELTITVDDIGGTWKKVKEIVDKVDTSVFANYKGGDAA